MSIEIILIFAATEFLLSLAPGPAVLLVVGQGMRAGFSSSVKGSLGILTGNAVYFALSAFGLGAVLLASAKMFTIIKYAGVAYLVYLGVQMILTKTEPEEDMLIQQIRPNKSFKLFSQGLITQLSNPKAVVFFTALLPQFVTPANGNITAQFLTLGVVSIAIELPILLLYGWLAERGQKLLPTRWVTLPDRIGGAFLVATGITLALKTQSGK
jgi:threonine/homoserine/homoserine lactone efflux protein